MRTVLIFILHLTIVNSIEPIISVIVGSLSIFGFHFLNISYAGYEMNLKCKFKECCDDDWIRFNNSGLEQDLNEKVFGQHFVHQLIPPSLREHINNKNPKSALVMSFNGPTGCGKNYVKQIIAKHLYVKGMMSDYVYFFDGVHPFLHNNKEAEQYKEKIKKEIEEATKKCGRSLFVFDNVDKMPKGVLDVLKPYIDNHHQFDGVNYKKNIFLFLSNTGEKDITAATLKFCSEGKREDMTLKDIENSIVASTLNEKGGLQNSEIVKRSLIDLYVPFLPLEKRHVKQCIDAEFKRRGIIPSRADINKVANLLDYTPKEIELFSTSGCRKIDTKIDVHYDYLPSVPGANEEFSGEEFTFQTYWASYYSTSSELAKQGFNKFSDIFNKQRRKWFSRK